MKRVSPPCKSLTLERRESGERYRMLQSYPARLLGIGIGGAALCACANLTSPTRPLEPGPLAAMLRAVIGRDEAKWIAFRRDLHRHPELSGAESRTSGLVASELDRKSVV